MIAGAEDAVIGEHETAGGAAVPERTMLAFVEAGHNQYALTVTLGDLGGRKFFLAGLLQGEGALFAVKLLE